MATAAEAIRSSEARRQQDEQLTIPSPAKVRAAAAEIRKSWSPRQRRRRAQLARSMLKQQFAAGALATCFVDEGEHDFTPTFPLLRLRRSPR